MNAHVFREYDIRGHAERDLDDDFTVALGRALGTHLIRNGKKTITTVALGRDCRLSSPRLHAALTRGLSSTGVAIIDVGLVATPQLYFAVFHLSTDGGVMITGSHNQDADNGFKIMRGRSTIYGDEVQALRKLMLSGDFVSGTSPPVTTHHLEAAYVAMIAERTQLGPRRMKIVVDAGNGMGGVAVPALRELGFDVTPLYCEQDGHFPNHHPDPTVESNLVALKQKVQEVGAEVGIGLDGDADRLGIVDARGRMVWGDQLMILFARAILKEVPGATFVSEVKCSNALYEEISRAGGKAIMWKVGHSLIKEKMKTEGAQLAGEMSGHIFFAHRFFGYDDAIYAAARLLELLSHDTRTLADHVDTLPQVFNTPELRYALSDDIKFEVVRRVVARFGKELEVNGIDGARITWPNGNGWALVRASNTQPALVLRFEAPSPARLAELRGYVEGELALIEAEVNA